MIDLCNYINICNENKNIGTESKLAIDKESDNKQNSRYRITRISIIKAIIKISINNETKKY